MQNTGAMALGSTGKISSCCAWRGSLDCHKQENVDEFCALALMRAVEDAKTACLHVDTTERTRGASMLRVWLHLPQPFTVPQLCSRPTPSTLSLRPLLVTLLFAVMHALCHRLRWSPRLPHLPNRALSPRSAATANALRMALRGAPSLARRLRERGRRRARKEVTRSMWRDIKLQVRSFATWAFVMYRRPIMMSITRATNCCCCVLVPWSRRTGGLARALVRSVCLSSTSTRLPLKRSSV